MKLLEYYKTKNTKPFIFHETLTPANYLSFAKYILKNASKSTINEVKDMDKQEAFLLSVDDFQVWEAYKLVNNEDV